MARPAAANVADRAVRRWLIVGWAGLLVLPWYDLPRRVGFVDALLAVDVVGASAVLQVILHGRWWLLPLLVLLALPVLALGRERDDPRRVRWLLIAGLGGFGWLVLQGFAIGMPGTAWAPAAGLFGAEVAQRGFGVGAFLVAAACLFLATEGFAARGAINGDGFVVGAVGLVVVLVAAFIFWPVSAMLQGAVLGPDGSLDLDLAASRFADQRLWSTACLTGGRSCGTAWNTLFLGIMTGLSTTILGLAFALIAVRTRFPFKGTLRALTILPIITPPFVIGLAIILLLGRSGIVTQFLWEWFQIPPTRYIYGFYGIWLAQTLAFTPIAFLVLIGVVQAVSPSMEEAAQTLRASRWQVFTTVTLPLLRPGLANAFLLSFIESISDFGNPIVLGGSYNVLATDIFFAIVGAQYDAGRAAVLAVVLLGFTLGAFWLQNRWLGRRSYTTVTGKGDGGVPAELPTPIRLGAYALALPWAALTAVIYLMILFGGFVELWGRDHSFTLRHFEAAFSIGRSEFGLVWSGAAWNSFFTTLQVSILAAVPTAAIGILIAYLLARQRFTGQRSFEFTTLLSFAIPGTVIGVSYIIAFNVPPLEMTGTGLILVLAFVFRNMPVGVRAGIAGLSQLDKSLDEASLTLRASTPQTIRRVLLPLLRPAILAALVYSFVTAMTAISAVVFLVSARYNMATTYILGRVENGDFGIAIAYCAVLIVVMALAILLLQLLIGERRLGRRTGQPAPTPIVATG
ncbi:MAG: iron ABC transporter permease [Geminicoccaceae bacterium]|nr:MAG: iron ABC transporter permease [Geminicoccaceae bacterium]